MKPTKPKRILILAAILTCCGTASSQTAKVVESLPDGSFIVSIDGKDFRAVNADKVRETEKAKIDLSAAQKINQEKDTQIAAQSQEIALLKKDVQIVGMERDSLKADFARSQEDAKRNFSLYMTERDLRVEAQQFIPHGKVNGFGGKVLSFLDSGYGQSLFKLAIPAATFLRTYTARCTP